MVDGCDHKMTIHDAILDDDAEYTVKIGDQSTTGRLNVEGKFCVYLYIYHTKTLHITFNSDYYEQMSRKLLTGSW